MNEELKALLDSYDDSPYPAPFLAEYTLMECLSDRNGIQTFLVQNSQGIHLIAKCYDKSLWSIRDNRIVLSALEHKALPRLIDTFENEKTRVTVREYIEGISLDQYAADHSLSQEEIVRICVQLCDILGYLHHREAPVIHRDVKPQNVIVRPDGHIALIDFDIARIYRRDSDSDTMFFGTLAYAPPEQYGFSQTDGRTDIYALGVLLRWLLIGSTRDNQNIRVYRPLAKIIRKCTAFAPNERFSDAAQVKKALLQANPKSQALRLLRIALCTAAAAAVLVFAGVKVYQAVTYSPFTSDAIPAYFDDEERVTDAVAYLKTKYGTSLFDDVEETATVGDLRRALIDLYGLDRDYVYGINEEMPQENDAYFLPWGWEDSQTLDRDFVVYAAIKVHDPAIVADWSSLKDDNGYYPGLRVAVAFGEDTGITTGVNRPDDITLGELALILANADRVFDAAETEGK